MSYETETSFQNGIWATLAIISIASIIFIGGRGCQQLDDKNKIKICGVEKIECYKKVIGIGSIK